MTSEEVGDFLLKMSSDSLETSKGPAVGKNIALAESWQGFNLFLVKTRVVLRRALGGTISGQEAVRWWVIPSISGLISLLR